MPRVHQLYMPHGTCSCSAAWSSSVLSLLTSMSVSCWRESKQHAAAHVSPSRTELGWWPAAEASGDWVCLNTIWYVWVTLHVVFDSVAHSCDPYTVVPLVSCVKAREVKVSLLVQKINRFLKSMSCKITFCNPSFCCWMSVLFANQHLPERGVVEGTVITVPMKQHYNFYGGQALCLRELECVSRDLI